MKVKELIEHLNQCNPEAEVELYVEEVTLPDKTSFAVSATVQSIQSSKGFVTINAVEG